MKKYTLSIISALAVSAALIFTGCGGQENETAASSPESSASAESGISKDAGDFNTDPTDELIEEPVPAPSKEVTTGPSAAPTGTASESPGDQQSSDRYGEGENTPSSGLPSSPEPTPEVPAFVGNWIFYSMEHNDPESSISHEEVIEMAAQAFDYSSFQQLTLRDDGTCVINIMEDISEGQWTDAGDGTGTITANGEEKKIELDGKLLKVYAADSITSFEKK